MTDLVTTWVKGALARYESMSSLAARYCEANAISVAAFGSVIRACLKRRAGEIEGDRSDVWSICTVDAEAFNVRTLSCILSEPSSIIETMSHRPFCLGSVGFTGYLGASREERFAELWACPECLRSGYHSVLHQVAWIKRCFIHGCSLICLDRDVTPTRQGVAADTRCSSALHRFWFGQNPKFRISGVPPFDREDFVIPARALEIAAELNRACRRILSVGGDDVGRVADATTVGRVVICATEMAGVRLPRRIVGNGNPKFQSQRLFMPLEPEEVRLLQDNHAISRQWERYSAARVLQCLWEGEFPLWRTVGIQILQRMTGGHEECIRKTRDVLAASMGWWRYQVRGQPEELTFAEAVRERRLLPCQRTLSVSLWTRRYQAGRLGYRWEAAWPFNDMPQLATELWGATWRSEVAGQLFKVARPPPRQDRDSGEWVQAAGVEDIILDSNLRQSVRRVRPSVLAPRGVLATLVDEFLLEQQWAAAWALYDCESKVTVDISFGGGALGAFSAALDRRAPPYAVRIEDMGAVLRLWPQSPREHPPWNSAGVVSGKHAQQSEQLWEKVFRAIDEVNAKFHDAICIATSVSRPGAAQNLSAGEPSTAGSDE